MSRKKPLNFYIFVISTDTEVLLHSETHYFPWTSVNCFTKKPEELSWKSITENYLRTVFLPEVDSFLNVTYDEWMKEFARSFKLSRLLRMWYPISQNHSAFVQRHIFWKKLTQEEKERLQQSEMFNWIALENVNEVPIDSETAEIVHKIRKTNNMELGFKGQEFLEENFIFEPQTDPEDHSNPVIALLTAAKFGKPEQTLIFREFFFRCLPRVFMSFETFSKFMTDLEWETSELRDLFRCFKLNPNSSPHFLSYNEVISGLAIIQPLMPHGDYSGEMRCRYIFKFYNKTQENKLNFKEFCTMIKDIRKKKGMSTGKVEIEREAALSASVFGSESIETLSLADFLVGVGQLKFRGTSILLRSSMSIIDYVKEQELLEDQSETLDTEGSGRKRRKDNQNVEHRHRNPSIASESSLPSFLFNCFADEEMNSTSIPVNVDDKYEFATHVIKVKRSGQVTEVRSLWELEGGAVSASAEFSSTLRFQFGRMASVTAFNGSSEANEMLKGLRYFEKSSKSDKSKKPMTWGVIDMQVLATSLIKLCKQVKNLLIQEPRLLQVKTPVYVLGDLHGNFGDLVCFEKTLWRMGTNITPANFLFLGDYVDRGDFGVEVVAYLFAQKIVAPTKVHLLRGNHEDRSIQKNFTFYRECLAKFGEEMGKNVWEEINQAFDVMPIAAVVDGKIFCVHGGIPPPWMEKSIQALNQVSADLSDPENQNPLVWEYLWNDPVPADPVEIPKNFKKKLEESSSMGFIDNFRRGTGHMFTVKALDDFLERNNLSLIIRAHEVKPSGFQVQLCQKLITVFSSSKYCNGSNEAACVLIDNKKLRVIRLDTS